MKADNRVEKSRITIRKTLEEAFDGRVVSNESESFFRVTCSGESEEVLIFPGSFLPNGERAIMQELDVEPVKGFFNVISKTAYSNKKDNKAFFFMATDKYPDVLFSLEMVGFDDGIDGINHIELPKTEVINNRLKEDSDIVRMKKDLFYLVAIKIPQKDDGKRNYAALKNYIIASDNRTYNNLVRLGRDYIEVVREINKKTDHKDKGSLPHNLLVSGAPGTGKSHYLDIKINEAADKKVEGAKLEEFKKTRKITDDDAAKRQNQIEFKKTYLTRVTFFEDYAYESFVGCYKPVPVEGSRDKITYDYVPGPFIEVYEKAVGNDKDDYFLVIEEINRAKAASVFGDMFQLLDRDENGNSVYSIRPEKALRGYIKTDSMSLPSNMYIWATMNSADQGVLPLDAAFKRRWSQMYMNIEDDSDKGCSYSITIPIIENTPQEILWNTLRTAINSVITESGFDEDRCIGPWYFSKQEIDEINAFYGEKEKNKRKMMPNPIIDKLFYYLRQDLFRRNPSAIFNENYKTMSDIRKVVIDGKPISDILNLGEVVWSK